MRANRHRSSAPCIRASVPYLTGMTKLTLVQDQAIQALMAGIVGAEAFDRLFALHRRCRIAGPKDTGRYRRRDAEGSAIGSKARTVPGPRPPWLNERER